MDQQTVEQRLFIGSNSGCERSVHQPQGFREDDGKRQVNSEHDGQFDAPLQLDVRGDEEETRGGNSLTGVVENGVATDVFKESVAQGVIGEENNARHGEARSCYEWKSDGEFMEF